MVSVSSKNGTTSPKRKNTKSRNGCLTCKKKRLKCDETKPECLNCQKKKIKCGGYATNFKWRSFNDAGGDLFMSSEQNPIPLANEKKKRKTSSSCSLDLENRSLSQDEIFRKQSELASLSVTGKSIKEIEFQNNLIAKGINPNTYEKLHLKTEITPNSANESFNLTPHDKTKRSSSFPESITSPGERRSPFNRRYSTSSRSGILSEDINTSRIDYLAAAADAVRNSGLKKSPIPSFGVDGLSPDSVAILNKNTPISEGEGSIGLVHNSSELAQELNLTPSLSALINFAFTSDETKGKDDINLDFPLSPFNLNDSASHIPSATSDTDLSIVDGIETEFSYDQLPLVRQDQSPQNAQSPPLMFSSNKSLMLTSEHEQLLHLYSRYTCAIMSIKNGPNENPWRNLILPVAYKYPCLMNSVISMTLFHLAGHNSNKTASPYLRARGYAYMKKSLLELATDLSKTRKKDGDQQEVPADIALTTCLNLAVIESWDTHISSGIAHLKGAKSMIQKVLDLLKTLQQDIKKKKRELGKAPGDSRELTALVLEKKKSLQKKLAFVTDLEWERMLDVQCMEVQQESNDTLYLKYDSNHESNNGGIIAIPESLQYLFNVWIYFEVLAQMTTRATQDDKGIDLVATITTIAQKSRDKKLEFNSKLKTLASGYSDKGSESSPSTGSLSSEKSMSWNGDKFDFFQDFETVRCNNTYVDPLLGCAQSLFSIMGAVATLVSKIRRRNQEHENKGSSRFARNSLATITAASQLKHHLTEWSPTITASMIASSMKEESSKKASWDISSCIATAEAYRYATLLYLHHAVPEIPSIPSYEIAEKIFILLASIPASSDLHVVHIFPLLVSSCEAQPGEQREWCNSRWSILIDKLWIGNVDRSYEVVKEVWRRKDEHMEKYGNEKYGEKGEEGDPGRRICSQISGLMAAISRDKVDPHDDAYGGINSKFHWSSVMREWGWEVLLA